MGVTEQRPFFSQSCHNVNVNTLGRDSEKPTSGMLRESADEPVMCNWNINALLLTYGSSRTMNVVAVIMIMSTFCPFAVIARCLQ